MDVTPLVPRNRTLIQSYGNGRFVVADTPYEGSVILTKESIIDWSINKIEELSNILLEEIIQCQSNADLLLLGTGKTQTFPPKPMLEMLRAAGLVVEVMDTGAACRTYNVLLAEERAVMAALIAV
ncbi:MAG: Mth938-like domain-containing protein [Hyphomicrobiales bacterium]|nr:Mth938-like domain-containing protein [Hyphomicrobiales bacterium]